MHTHSHSSRFLDQVAISMAVICAIHCLVTPVLLIALPILATTIWVDANFHLWMLLLVIPTTTLAVWSGCRRHRDKWVIAMAAIGLGLLSVALVGERIAQATVLNESALTAQLSSNPSGCSSCGTCATPSKAGETSTGLPWHLILNVAGGLALATGHTRNFLLCRKSNCLHADHTHRGCNNH